MDVSSLQKVYHSHSYEMISEAMGIDEKHTSLAEKRRALQLYKKGTVELKNGIRLDISTLTGAKYERAKRLKEKMEKNLALASERIDFIDKLIANSKTETSTAPRRSVIPTAFAKPGPSSRPKVFKPEKRLVAKPAGAASNNGEQFRTAIKGVKGVDPQLGNFILDQVLETAPNITFDDVIGLQNAKQALYEAVILPALRPELFTGLRSPVQGILLFGPPGNGKSMLAKAVAGESKCVFFNVSAASLVSKWVGEAEKLVKALFLLARKVQPAIIFIDEIDSILRERSGSDSEVSRRLKTEFLVHFDGVGTDPSDRLLVMGATNRPYDLDEAVLRRFPRRIYVGLPELKDRISLLVRLLKEQLNCMTDANIHRIAEKTDGFSNSDLKNLAKEAAMGPLRDIPLKSLKEINPSQLRPVLMSDFDNALRKIRPSMKPEQVKLVAEFNKVYGENA